MYVSRGLGQEPQLTESGYQARPPTSAVLLHPGIELRAANYNLAPDSVTRQRIGGVIQVVSDLPDAEAAVLGESLDR